MSTAPPRQTQSSRTTPITQKTQRKQLLKYTSPRCDLEDAEFLPSSSLQDHDERWRHLMEQAGPHQQDASLLDLRNRQMTPATLKVGVTPLVASRVRELHVDFHSSYSLPEWLDTVCSLFFSLQHLYTTANYEEPDKLSMDKARMRRLYILYRLPHLLSIDGKNVTSVERQLARPSSPNGYKVKMEDWVVSDVEDDSSTISSEDDDSSVLQHHGDAVEVSLFGVVKRVNADPPKESWEEPELPKPFEHSTKSKQHQVTSVTKTVERAHRSMGKSSPPKEEVVKTPKSSCGGLAAVFADHNPCVGSGRRAVTDEPHTVDYPNVQQQQQQQALNHHYYQTDKYAVPQDCDRKERAPVPQQQAKKQSKETDAHASTPERTKPTTPNSPSTSLSSPFPMQFRSKSFNGALPSSMMRPDDASLPRKMSSPNLSPEKTLTENKDTNKGIKSKALSSNQRPPPCPPGSTRRVVPLEHQQPRRPRSWKSKNAIRSTSIVDDDDDDDCLSEDEDVIEHEY